MERYGSMVDLLGWAGLVEEAHNDNASQAEHDDMEDFAW